VLLAACGGSRSNNPAPALTQAPALATSAVTPPLPAGSVSPPPVTAAAEPRPEAPQTAAATAPPAGQSATATAAPSLTGQLLITREDGLYRRDMASGNERRLFGPPNGRFITFPAWSADGRRFAYVLSQPYQPSGDWGDDLYVANADGDGRTVAFRHDALGAQIESPSWSPDGNSILFSYLRIVLDKQGGVIDQIYEVRRLDLSGGTSTVLKDAGEPQLCADGSRFAYRGFDRTNNTWDMVGVANADGTAARVLVGTKDGLLTFFAPHPSPDCTRVVFSAVGAGPQPSSRDTPAASVPSVSSGHLLAALGESSRDGSPWDLWLVRMDGSSLTRLTQVNEDQPCPAWSRDGSTILFVGTLRLYAASADGSGLRTVAPGAIHAQIAWWQSP
jgi:Tol biopolymer transport system component